MPAFNIANVIQNEENNTYSLIYQLDSSYIPYGMQENFIIMEKTPVYLFSYFNQLFSEQFFNKTHTFTFKQKSLDNDKTEVTLTTNNVDFFKQLKEVVNNLEQHFNILLKDFVAFENTITFVEKIEKFNLHNKLQNKLEEKNTSSIRKKI